MDKITEIFMLFPFGILSGIIMSLACPFIGLFVVCRRDSFIALTLSEVAILGVAVSFFFNMPPFDITMTLTIAASLFILRLSEKKIIPSDSVLSAIFIFSSAVAILIVSKSGHGLNEVKNLFYGDLTLINISDFIMLLIFIMLVLFFLIMFFRNFLYTFIDRDYALLSGIFVEYWEFCYMFALGVIIAVTSFTSGILLSFCLLVVSPSIGMFLSRKIKSMIFISVLVSVFSIIMGFIVAYHFDIPVNQTICTLLCSIFIILSIKEKK